MVEIECGYIAILSIFGLFALGIETLWRLLGTLAREFGGAEYHWLASVSVYDRVDERYSVHSWQFTTDYNVLKDGYIQDLRWRCARYFGTSFLSVDIVGIQLIRDRELLSERVFAWIARGLTRTADDAVREWREIHA